MNVRNQEMETAIMNIKLRIGVVSRNTYHNPVKMAAKTPNTNVASWLWRYPIITSENWLNITVNVEINI